MNNPYTKYTMTYKEFCSFNQEWIDEVISLSTSEKSQKLKDAIYNTFAIYEISGETIGEFKEFFKDTFNLHKDYYEELITNYEKEFDYASAIRSKSGSKTTNQDIEVELPNKVIDEDDIYKYPNNGSKGTVQSENWNDNPSEFIRLKNQYLRQIRNCYNEFAMKFSDCFIHIY